MKVVRVSAPLFRREVVGVFGCSEAELASYLEKRYGYKHTVSGDAAGAFFEIDSDGSNVFLIWVKTWRDDFDSFCVLGHEVIHASGAIMAAAGVVYDVEKSDEVLTYLFEDLMVAFKKKL
jgi:hypothetical protein